MKRLTITTLMAFLAGLLAAGAALGEQQQRDEAQLQISANQLSSDQILELQRSLQKQGVDPGPVDGKMGPLTKQAIQVFQQQEGLAATGNLNEQTLDALDLEVQEFLGISPAFGEEQMQQREAAQLRISAQQLNSAQVRELQQSLQKQGVDPGHIDGKMGPLTKQAIQVFQQQEGLAATGEINERTLEALDIEVQEFMGMSPAFE
ncbi:MAG: peptidoglycan-binding protein [Desulfuromonadales bacterium]|nr:peptidoglycan-binding protein [Desulfuromonadales bacterium]